MMSETVKRCTRISFAAGKTRGRVRCEQNHDWNKTSGKIGEAVRVFERTVQGLVLGEFSLTADTG
jgi:hypothetical protein